MNIKPFLVEEWMNEYEVGAKYNIAETCVDSVSLDELFALTGEDKGAFLEELCARRLTYGDIFGLPAFKEGICRLYRDVKPEQVIPTHGAAGANHLAISSIVEPGDKVISVMPTYQQLYSIPESLGAEVEILKLRRENGFLPDLEELRRLAVPGTKLICINNPNNPSGALMSGEMMKEIVEIADRAGAYLLCDEVYRHLNQQDVYIDSAADLYEKGISVSSMSKVFSLAGLRLGWIASRDPKLRKAFLSHRDYSLISCGLFDEAVAAIALKNRDRLLERSRGIIRENLEILDQWVKKEPGVSYVKPAAGTTALLYFDESFGLKSADFCRRLLEEEGALMTPGSCFGEEGCARIGYACSREELEKGLAGLSRFLNHLRQNVRE